jgi:hypothetical protein
MDNAGEINDEKIVPISNVRELLENISRMEDVDRAG